MFESFALIVASDSELFLERWAAGTRIQGLSNDPLRMRNLALNQYWVGGGSFVAALPSIASP